MSSFMLIFRNIRLQASRILSQLNGIFKHEMPDIHLDLVDCNLHQTITKSSIFDNIFNRGILWAVPKHRRSLERRMTRRMGYGKMILPKKNIIVCHTCGHFHLVHTVCGNCYEKVKKETNLIQDAITKELKRDQVNEDVIILYKDDTKPKTEGKKIVEILNQRPAWFSKNLLDKDSEIKREKLLSPGTIQMSPMIEDPNDKKN